tara:strand:+ start:1318 stop:1518 length:201 start_codon:yes stop_codon:yes gene_type:complete
MKVYMKRPVTRTYEVLFDQADLQGFLSDSENGKGVGVTGLTITSIEQPKERDGAVLRICLTETSNA